MANEFIVRKGLIALADSTISGSLNVTGTLTGDGSGLTGITAVSAPAGSDGLIQYNNAGVTGGASTLYWDDTNSRLGIGTASPSSILEISDNTPILKITDNRNLNVGDWDDVSLGALQFATSDTTSPGARALAEIEAYSGVDAASGPEAELRFKTSTINDSAPVSRMVIDAQGRVGIGTTDMADTFQIHDANTTSNPKIKIFGYDTATSSAKYGSLHIGTDGSFIVGAQDTYLQLNAANYIQSNSVHFFTQGILQSNNKGFSIQESGGSFKSVMNVTTGNLVTLGGVGSGWTSGGDVALFTAGSEKVRIDTSGNVGIGTTNPSYKLEVNGTARFGDGSPYLKVTTSSVEVEGAYLFAAYQSGVSFYAYESVFRGLIKSDGSGGNALKLGDTQERMRIVGGNVGIGTTNPSTKLQVAGTPTTANFTIGDISNSLVTVLDTTTPSAVGVGGRIAFGSTYYNQGNTVGQAYIGGYKENAPSNGSNEYYHALVFGTHTSSGVGVTEKMRITSSGKVGIGSTSPIAKLHIRHDDGTYNGTFSKLAITGGNGGNNQIMKVDYTGDAGIMTIGYAGLSNSRIVLNGGSGGTASGFGMYHASTQKVAINANANSYFNGGNVGIGITNPSGKLHIDGTYLQNANTGVGTNLVSSLRYGGDTNYRLDYNQIVTSGLVKHSYSVVNNGTGYVNNLVLDRGNVGIGTTNPTETLHLYDAEAKINFESSHGRTSSIQQGGGYFTINADNVNGVAINYLSSNQGKLSLFNNTTSAIRLNANGTTYFNGGNVGIGTTSPTQKLYVDGGNIQINNSSSGTTPGLYISNASQTGNQTQLFSDTTGVPRSILRSTERALWLQANSSAGGGATNDLRLYTNGNLGLAVAENGNVGIGTTSPSQKLDVDGNIALSSGGYIYGDSTTPNIRLSTSGGAFLQYGSSSLQNGGSLQFVTSSGTMFRINQGGGGYVQGNFGIGVTSPGEKLTVAGKILATNGSSLYIDAAASQTVFASPTSIPMRFQTDSTNRFTIGGTGIVTAHGDMVVEGNFTVNGTTTTINSTTLTVANKKIVVAEGAADAAAAHESGIEVDGADATMLYRTGSDSFEFNKGIVTSGDLTVAGRVTAQEFHTEFVSSSVIFESGSTQFGNSSDDTHTFTGTLTLAGATGNTTMVTTGAGDFTLAAADDIRLDAGGNDVVYRFGGTEVGRMQSANGTTDFAITSSQTNRNILLLPNGTGNVGIGTTSPSTILDVRGEGATSNPATSGTTVSTGTRFRIASSTTATAVLDFGISTAGKTWLQSTDRSDLSTEYPLLLNPNGGNVGIGTTTPAAKLDVNGGINVTQNSYINWGGGSRIVGSSSYLRLQTSAQDRISITNTGNVGIGTISPDSKVHIEQSKVTVNTTNLDNGTAVGLHLTYPNTDLTGGEGIALAMGMNGRGRSYIANISATTNKDASDMAFYTENGGVIGERVRINSAGNVGIGTTAPSAKLEVSGDLKVSDTIQLGQQQNIPSAGISHHTNGYLYIKGGTAGAVLTNDSVSSAVYVVDNGTLEFYAGSTNKMHITSAGNVGIGTTSPLRKLHVAGDIELSGAIYGQNTDHTYLEIANSGYHQRFFTRTDGGVASERFTIEGGAVTGNTYFQNTNVGIGTTSPTRRLDVRGSGIVSANFERSGDHLIDIKGDGAYNGIRLYDGGNHKISMTYITADNNLQFGTNWAGGSEVMVINASTSNVGIGTTSPSGKLDVRGGKAYLMPSGTSTSGTDSHALVIRNLNDDVWPTAPLSAYNANTSYDIENRSVYTFSARATAGNIEHFANYTNTEPVMESRFIRLNDTNTSTLNLWKFYQWDGVGTGRDNLQTPNELWRVTVDNGSTDSDVLTLSGTGNLDVAGVITATGGNSTNWNTAYSWGDHSTQGYITSAQAGLDQATADTRYVNVTGDTMTGPLTVQGGGNTLVLQKGTGNPALAFGGTSDEASALLEGIAGGGLKLYTSNGGTLTTPAWSAKMTVTAAGSIGIGTTAPQLGLHIKGDASVSGVVVERDGGQWARFSAGSVGTALRFANGGSFSFGPASSIGDTSVASAFYIDGATSNIGIGTTSPAAKLSISADQGDGILLQAGNSLLGNTGSGYSQLIYWGGTAMFYGRNTPTVPGGVGASVTDHIFRTGGTTRMTVNAAGNVEVNNNLTVGGVITAQEFRTEFVTQTVIFESGSTAFGNSDDDTHEFTGRVQASSTGTAGVPVVDIINTSSATFNHSMEVIAPNMTAGENNIIIIGRQSNTKNSGYIGYKYSAAGSNANVLTFGHWGSDNLMNLTGDGKLGIGTITPAEKLHVNDGALQFDKTNGAGSGDFDFIKMGYNGSWSGNQEGIAAISVDDGTGIVGRYGITYGAGGGRFVITDLYDGGYASSGDVFYVRGDGDTYIQGSVGIGTESPTEKLEVVGDVKFGGTTSGDWAVFQHGTKSIQLTQSNAGTGGHQMRFRTPGWSTDAFIYTNGSTERFRITGVGNVGIGTESPQSKLHVKDTASTNSLVTMRVENDLNYSEFGTQSGYARILSGGSLVYAGSGSATYMYYAGSALLSLVSNNVGIGTTNPSEKLDVAGNIKVTSTSGNTLRLYNAGSNSAQIYGTGANYGIRIDSPSTSSTYYLLNLTAGSNTNFIVKNNGAVGIGTSAPTAKLEVVGDGSLGSNFKFKQAGSQEHFLYAATNTQYNLIGSSTPKWVWGQHNGAERMRLDNTSLLPGANPGFFIGSDARRWEIVFCNILDSAGLHEKNLENPEGEKQVGEYATGTVLVWKGGKNVPCTAEADHMRMGVAVEGMNSPLVQGAEPVLVTGIANEGDYLITSEKEGHARAISREEMLERNLYDCVIGKALETGSGQSYLLKVWITI